jgi:hypothetical protein
MRLFHMPKALRVAILGISVGLLGWAQTQVATITSSAPFRLRGATITPGEGVPSWPVLPGDTVQAGNALTIITFTDGSTVSLEPGTEGNVDLSGGAPSFQLASGTVVYSLKSQTAVKLFSGDKPVNPPGLTGTYSRNGGQRPVGGFWTPAHTVIVAGAGAGAATGIALGVAASSSSGSQVSPSH